MARKIQTQNAKKHKVTYEDFIKRYWYNPDDGHFYDKRPVDRPDCYRGYRNISVVVNHVRYFVKAHQAAFLVMTGKWPENDVDHIDGKKDNNTWKNLRDVSISENLHNIRLRPNNKSGCHGVSWRKDLGKWMAGIDINGKRKYLGLFKNVEDAIAVREKALIEKFTPPS